MIKKFKLFENKFSKSSTTYSYGRDIPQLTEEEINHMNEVIEDSDRILQEYDLIVKIRKPNLPYIDIYRKETPQMPRGVYDVHRKQFTMFFRGDTLLDQYLMFQSDTFYDELDEVDYLLMTD
jgi:DNA-binding Lrp family transcriptional regulator